MSNIWNFLLENIYLKYTLRKTCKLKLYFTDLIVKTPKEHLLKKPSFFNKLNKLTINI